MTPQEHAALASASHIGEAIELAAARAFGEGFGVGYQLGWRRLVLGDVDVHLAPAARLSVQLGPVEPAPLSQQQIRALVAEQVAETRKPPRRYIATGPDGRVTTIESVAV